MRPELKRWADEHIVWAGNTNTNRSGRMGIVPDVIVNHISEGTLSSMTSWFTSPGNKVSSAHFGVGRKGEVRQYVAIEDMAWANGLNEAMIPSATSAIVRERSKLNPNLYTVSIEHEGVWEETRGELTAEQLKSTIALHQYIIEYVFDKYGVNIKPTRDRVIGHCEISPKGKPNCPGERFPFNTLIKSIGGEIEVLPFSDIQDHWARHTIVEVNKLGLMSGSGSKQFRPNEFCTRAELAQVILNVIKYIDK